MDVNGTRLHLVLGVDDWKAAIVRPVDPAVCYDRTRNTLGLRPRPFVFPTRPDAPRLTPADRRGADADRFGNRFWVGPGRDEILALGAGQAAAFRYWSAASVSAGPAPAGGFVACTPEVGTPPVLAGLAVTTAQYLVVGATGLPTHDGASASGLLVFDLACGGPPVVLTWRTGLDVRPIDITALPDGGFVVLDADDTAPGPARLWWFDARHRVVDLAATGTITTASEPPFAPVDPVGAPATVAPSPAGTVDLGSATEAHGVEIGPNWAVAVDALPDGSVVVLDRMGPDGQLDVGRWRCGEQLPFGLRVAEEADDALELVCSDQRVNAADLLVGMVGHDLAVEPGTDGSARLYVVDELGDQAFEFLVTGDGAELVADYHPLRLFGGIGLVVSCGVAEYDLGQRWFPIPVRPVERFATGAEVVLAPEDDVAAGRGFDAGTEGTIWHRILLDATIPAGTSVTVETRAADDLAVLERRPWDREPDPYLRGDGSEIAYHRYPDGDACAGQGTWELLVQRAVGRYLQIRLTIQGDGRRTPRIWALRAHAPRFSYLGEYLPDIYRADRDSASFLDRYLANVEGMYTTLEGRIVDVQRLFDPSATDPEFLPWLASWVGAAVEPDWEPERKRLLVRHAARLFARRGTPRGLVEAIRLATHPCPTDAIFDPDASSGTFDVRIVEAFRTRAVPGMTYGDPGDLAGPRFGSGGPNWELVDGRSQLEDRWTGFLSERHPPTGDGASLSARVAAAWSTDPLSVGVPPRFPVLTPSDAVASRDWRDFVRSELSMTYADVGSADDLTDYRRFLEQRYRRVEDYHSAWNLQGASKPASFDVVAFPTGLPADGAPLQDWITFVSSVLPIRRSAHRCSVLVPVRFDDTDAERTERLGRVERVVDVDRPAHTLVTVEPYWAALRVGEARVGLETIVGEGSRYVDLVLGTGRPAHAAVPGGRTWRLDDRMVVDRDRIERSVEPAGTGGMT